MEQMQEFETEARNDLIEGRNAVIEALRAGRTIDKIFIAKGDVDKTLGHIASKARSAGIVVTEADRRKLDAMSQTHAHQGVIALCAVKEYSTIEDMLAVAAERGEAPFLVLCDEISDPHNLGAIIRTAECVGAHGVIIPKRRSAGLTAIVDKASAGALEHMAIARVPNLVAAIETLKKNGLWIYGTAAEGSNELWKTDLTGPACIVIGSEGSGISRVQWIAMYYVNGCPSITQKQLADKMNLKEPTVVRLLDRMEADHMLRRVCSRTDRRVRYLEMTEQGMELYQGLLGRVEQFKEDAIKGIDEEKLEVFKEVLGQMLNNTEH